MINYDEEIKVFKRINSYVNKVSATTQATPIRERRAFVQDDSLV